MAIVGSTTRAGLVDAAVRQADARLVGREREITTLTAELAATGSARSFVVQGRTGMGKSALLSVASSIAVRTGLRPVRGLRSSGRAAVWPHEADRRVLLVVDDVEHLDDESLHGLARFARTGSVLLAGDVDRAAPSAGLDDVVADALRVPLAPIGADDVAEMIRRKLRVDADPQLTALCLEYSGGAPGVLTDVLDAVSPAELSAAELSRRLPGLRLPRLVRAVRRRWQELDSDAVAVARALSVAGPAALDVVAALAAMPPAAAQAAVERLVDRGLVVTGDVIRFESPALACAVRQEMEPQERDRLHHRAARELQVRRAPATMIADHLLACAEPVGEPWAARVLRTAAGLHRAGSRAQDALRCLRSAVREPMAPAVREQVATGIAEVVLRCGAEPPVTELAQCWHELPGAGTASGWLASVIFDWQGDERLLSVLGVNGDAGESSTARAVAMTMSAAGARTAFDLRGTTGDSLPALALDAFWDSLTRTDGACGAAAVLAAVTTSDGAAGPWLLPTLALSGMSLLHTATPAEFESRVLEAVRRLRPHLTGAEADWLLALEAWAHHAGGRTAAAERIARTLLDGPQARLRGCAVLAAAALVAAAVDAGTPGAARELLLTNGLAAQLPPSWVSTYLLHQRGRMNLVLGAPRAALADELECGERLKAWGVTNSAVAPWRQVAAQAQLELGERRRAGELLGHAAATAEVLNLPGAARKSTAAPRSQRPSSWHQLTPHEARIVRFALDGKTNREIAAIFNVTQRAVELHLTRVYRKVGITRRVQLPAVFGEHANTA